MVAIFGPSSPYTYGIVANIATRFDIPHIDYVWRLNEEPITDQEPQNPMPMTTNIYPDSDMVSKVSKSGNRQKYHLRVFKNIDYIKFLIFTISKYDFILTSRARQTTRQKGRDFAMHFK